MLNWATRSCHQLHILVTDKSLPGTSDIPVLDSKGLAQSYLTIVHTTAFIIFWLVIHSVSNRRILWNPKFITAFTSARHLSLFWASSIQSILPHSTSWRSILILSSHLWLGLPSGLFPSGLPTKTLYTRLLSPIRATCPTHLILRDSITRTIFGEQYRSLSS